MSPVVAGEETEAKIPAWLGRTSSLGVVEAEFGACSLPPGYSALGEPSRWTWGITEGVQGPGGGERREGPGSANHAGDVQVRSGRWSG